MPSLMLGAFNMNTAPNTSAQVLAEGTSRGTPVPIEQTVNTWLQDGAIVVTQGHDNREVMVRVRFYGTNTAALNTLEASLFAELEKPNTLTWTPDGGGTASVFVVITSSLVQDDDDTGEGQVRPWRTYTIRLVCEAFVRSASETVTTALAASGTTTTSVNTGAATTNWTGFVDGVSSSPSVVSGALCVTNGSAVYGPHTVSAVLTTAITTSATKYLVVDWKPESNAGSPSLTASGDGVALDLMYQSISPTAGFTRSVFGPVAASSIAALRLDSYSFIPSTTQESYTGQAAATRSIYIDNIDRTDVKPYFGSARQTMRIMPVGGSARTQASLAIEHSSSALGDVYLYTYPSAVAKFYTPPLRQYRTASSTTTVTTDTARVSGAREVLTGGVQAIYQIPVSKLSGGSHVLACRLLCSTPVTAATITYTVVTRVNSTDIGPSVIGTSTVTLTTTYANFALVRLTLPTADVVGDLETSHVQITLNATSTGTVTLDEAWLFNTDIGQLIQVACGSGSAASGGPARRLFVEPPSVSTPRPIIRIGHAADRSDAFYPNGANASLTSWQIPELRPPDVAVFLATSNALDASITKRGFNRWFGNAGN